MFNAVHAAQALRRPAVILPRRGWFWTLLRLLGVGVPPKKYEGRILSHIEWQAFAPRIDQLAAGELDPQDAGRLLIEYFDEVGVPWSQLKHQPSGVIESIVADFFHCQAVANRTTLPTSLTNGRNLLVKVSDEQPR